MSERRRRDPAGPERALSGAGSDAGFEVAKPNDQELMNVAGRHEDPTDAFPTDRFPLTRFPPGRSPPGPAPVAGGVRTRRRVRGRRPGWVRSAGLGVRSGRSSGRVGRTGPSAGARRPWTGCWTSVDLGDDPFDDDLTSQLKARTPLKLTSRTTLALSGAVLVVAGFIGGVLVQKNFGTTTPAANNRAGIGALANGLGGTGGAAANGGRRAVAVPAALGRAQRARPER